MFAIIFWKLKLKEKLHKLNLLQMISDSKADTGNKKWRYSSSQDSILNLLK